MGDLDNVYDIAVIGAGPAGCQCARLLSQLGWKILLVERMENFSKNNFSSAGTVIDILKDYHLPASVVGAYWKDLVVISTKEKHKLTSDKILGVVLDFKKLREYLTEQATKTGNCTVLFGTSYSALHKKENLYDLTLYKHSEKIQTKTKAKIIIDATGPARAVLYEFGEKKPRVVTATGIEYLIEVDKQTAKKLSETTLHFFLGYTWTPKGYGWIFPMGETIFKIGVGGFNTKKPEHPYKYYLDNIVANYLHLKDYTLIETHGSTIGSTFNHADKFYNDMIIGTGDSISTVNFLGGEGIRHALYSATEASKYVDLFLRNKTTSFASYEKSMKRYFGQTWNLSFIFSNLLYKMFSDRNIDRFVKLISYLSAKELTGILFYYRFRLLFTAFLRKIKTK